MWPVLLIWLYIFVLLQIKSMPIGVGLPSPAILLFNMPIRALLHQSTRESINYNVDNKTMRSLNCDKINI